MWCSRNRFLLIIWCGSPVAFETDSTPTISSCACWKCKLTSRGRRSNPPKSSTVAETRSRSGWENQLRYRAEKDKKKGKSFWRLCGLLRRPWSFVGLFPKPSSFMFDYSISTINVVYSFGPTLCSIEMLWICRLPYSRDHWGKLAVSTRSKLAHSSSGFSAFLWFWGNQMRWILTTVVGFPAKTIIINFNVTLFFRLDANNSVSVCYSLCCWVCVALPVQVRFDFTPDGDVVANPHFVYVALYNHQKLFFLSLES